MKSSTPLCIVEAIMHTSWLVTDLGHHLTSDRSWSPPDGMTNAVDPNPCAVIGNRTLHGHITSPKPYDLSKVIYISEVM
jgi:hypothetical protein